MFTRVQSASQWVQRQRRCAWLFALVWAALVLLNPAHARSPQPQTVLEQQARVTFNEPSGGFQTVSVSNRVQVMVQPVASASLVGPQQVRRLAGAPIQIPYTLRNTGNTPLQFQLTVSNAAQCSSQAAGSNLSDLQVVPDTNHNGMPDANEPNTSLPIELAPSGALSLIVVGRTAQSIAPACLQLNASSTNGAVSLSTPTQVVLEPGPAIVLRKSSQQAQPLRPGSAQQATFTIEALNTGDLPAFGVQQVSPTLPIRIDGQPMPPLFMLHDPIPANSQYVANSLAASHDGALRLYRSASMPAYAYATQPPSDGVVEVAVAFPFAVSSGQMVSMSFAITAQDRAFNTIQNTATALYCEKQSCSTATAMESNVALANVETQRLGVAHWVQDWRYNTQSSGQPDQTVTYTMGAKVANAGNLSLHNLKLQLPLSGNTRFGQYTANAVPGPNQYTVVPGSVRLAQSSNTLTVVNLNTAFNGHTDPHLLPVGNNGTLLPPNAEFTLYYDVRVNVANKDEQDIFSQLQAQASLSPLRTSADATDQSTEGRDPDPDGDGNPYNNNQPTRITLPNMSQIVSLAQGVTVELNANPPRKIRATSGKPEENKVYEIDVDITVRNNTDRPTAKLRLVNNLSCPLLLNNTNGNIESWSLTGRPRLLNGSLELSPLYTGEGGCDGYQNIQQPHHGGSYPVRYTQANTTPAQLILNNVNDTLAPRTSATIRVTIQVVKKDPTMPFTFVNGVWLLATQDDKLIDTQVLSSSLAKIDVELVDPQGYVFDSVTREPVAGATVTLKRVSCDNGPATPIRPNEIFGGSDPRFTYNADGTVSKVTDTTGEYRFVLASPPVNNLCTYNLQVQPPANYVRSALFPPQPGVYTQCAFVVPDDFPPKGANTPLTWFENVSAGVRTNQTACGVMHNHIPLDPVGLSQSLLVEKKASQSQVELGDVVDYTIRLVNQANTPIESIVVDDLLPSGFVMVKGSARLNNQPWLEPEYVLGQRKGQTLMRFNLRNTTLASGASLVLSYRMRVGVGAVIDAYAVNTATVFANTQVGPTPLRSLPAQARVRVHGGVFSDQGYALGRVWADCNRNGLQDSDDEPGIAGVRLYLEDGTSVETDAFGRWSLSGLRPGTRVLRLDTTTLPPGAQVRLTSQRQAGQAHSRFLDIQKGELVRADFAVDACHMPELLQAIAQRNEQALGRMANATGPEPSQLFDQRANNTSGTTSPRAFQTPQSNALIQVAPSQPTQSLTDTLLGPLATLSAVPLETVAQEATSQLQFLELQDGNTVLERQLNIRVAGPAAGQLVLSVNGKEVSEQRVGKRINITSKGLQALEYIAVELEAGRNALQLQLLDPFGNVRDTQELHVIAAGGLSLVAIDTTGPLYADPGQEQTLRIRLLDAQGIPVTARTALTVQADKLQWLTPDLNPDEPGLQVLTQEGEATIRLRSPSQPGTVRIQVRVSSLKHEQTLSFVPSLKALQGIGIVEGVINLGNAGRLSLSQPQAANAFERELSALSGAGNDRTTGRVAFYFKGTIKGEYLLTAAYDSDKPTRQSAVQNIQPEQFYPVYGDASTSSNDAQSSGRLFVRIDKNLSYLLLGDINTASSNEVRTLSQYSRQLPGVQHQYQTDKVRATTFYAETTSSQRVEEIPATGLSFYNLEKRLGDIRPGSERVEVVVRDRSQPQRVLRTRALAAMADYSFEPLTGRLFLVEPVASLDADLNPQFVRVTYEHENGGELSPVMGADVQVKISDELQLGGVVVKDDSPGNNTELQAITAIVKTPGGTQLSAELARTLSDQKGSGQGARLQVEHRQGPITAKANLNTTDPNFTALGATSSAGRTELSANLDYAVSADTQVRLDATTSKSEVPNTATTEQTRVGLAVAKRWNEQVSTELGIRRTEGQSEGRLGLDTSQVSNVAGVSPTSANTLTSQPSIEGTTVRAKVTVRPHAVPRLQLSTELEHSTENDQRAITTGVDYALTASTRAYLRHTQLDGLGSNRTVNGQNLSRAFVLGIDSAYTEGGRVYNEYRVNNGTTQNATGLRHTYRLNEQWRLSGGVEHTRTLGANPVGSNSNTQSASGRSTAVNLGADWTEGPWRVGGSVERRWADAGNTWLYNLAASWRYNHDVTLLARTTRNQTLQSGQSQIEGRDQIGVAWRPAHADRWNVLSRYEHRTERQSTSHIWSLHGHYQIDSTQSLSLRQAAKHTHTRDSVADSRFWLHLSHARYTVDIAPHWDLGLQLGHLWGRDGSKDSAIGLELGRQVLPGLWLSLGHNVRGLSAPDLVGQNYTSQGTYIRLRWKFDESVFQFGRVADRTEPTPAP